MTKADDASRIMAYSTKPERKRRKRQTEGVIKVKPRATREAASQMNPLASGPAQQRDSPSLPLPRQSLSLSLSLIDAINSDRVCQAPKMEGAGCWREDGYVFLRTNTEFRALHPATA